jgi:hypothetical protein
MFVLIVIGLSMKVVGSICHDYVYFKYEHNTNYQKIQKRFFEAVESLNHDNVLVSSQSKNILTVHSFKSNVSNHISHNKGSLFYLT